MIRKQKHMTMWFLYIDEMIGGWAGRCNVTRVTDMAI